MSDLVLDDGGPSIVLGRPPLQPAGLLGHLADGERALADRRTAKDGHLGQVDAEFPCITGV